MFSRPTAEVRAELLALNGVGPETADSILLYAGNHPVFVVDAYTRRIFERHGIISNAATHEEIRELCEKSLAAAGEEPRASEMLKNSRPTSRVLSSTVAHEYGTAQHSGSGIQ
jgi:endonuclease III-like uncharacterized protein